MVNETPQSRVSFVPSADMAKAIAGVSRNVSYAPGDVLFRKDDPADTFFVLSKGEVEISVTSADGRKLTLEILTRNEVFGEIGFFIGSRTADAMALSPVSVSVVLRKDFMTAIRSSPDLSLEIIDLLCARLRTVSDKVEERTFLPLSTRLARRFLHLASKYDSSDGTIPLSQAELADVAGATREAVAKALAVWRRNGWVEMTRGAVRIREIAALQVLAQSDE